MSLFEKIKNKRYELVEAQDQQNRNRNRNSGPDYSETSSRTGRKKSSKGYDPATDLIYGDQRDDKGRKKYTKYETDRAKTLKTTPAKLEKDVQKGLKGLGGRTSRFPFARKSYKTDAKAILGARQKYKLDPSGNVDMKTTKARLVDRIVRNDPKFNTGSATKFVDELEKSQGPLSKKTGKQSSLYKTVKAEIDARNPTVKSKVSGGKLPLRSKKTGEVVKKNLDKFYKKVADKVDPKFKTPKNLSRTELNLQFKADKLKQDYGGKLNPRDGLTDAARKKQIKKLKTDLNIKNPTITSPLTGGQLPATKANLKKLNLQPLTEPLKKPRVIKKTFKPPVKGNLFDPTGRIADETKKAKQSFKQFMNMLKTKYSKPNLEPLTPLKKPFIKPSTTTKTATKSKALLPKLMKAVRKNPKAALGVGLLTLGTYGMVKNRQKSAVKNKNKNLTSIPTKKDEIITRPVSQTFRFGPPRSSIAP